MCIVSRYGKKELGKVGFNTFGLVAVVRLPVAFRYREYIVREFSRVMEFLVDATA